MKLIIGFAVFVLSLNLYAYVATVIEVSGNAFSFSKSSPKTLQYGEEIADMTDLMVEDGSTLSIATRDEKVIHVSGGSLLKLYSGIIELKNGHVWISSTNKTEAIINSSNANARFGEGEFIYSFNNISGKTQVLVLRGDVKFSNSLEPELNVKVSSGYFSIVDPEYKNSLPRTPTRVGLKSYKESKETFAGFKDIDDTNYEQSIWGEKTKKQTASRDIASVKRKSSTKGKLYYIKSSKSSRKPASTGEAMNYYLEIKKKNQKRNKPIKNNKAAPIRYFGLMSKPALKESSAEAEIKKNPKNEGSTERSPASIGRNKLIQDLKKSAFEKSIEAQIPKNRRNPDEVNKLIDELKTYNQDYKKKY